MNQFTWYNTLLYYTILYYTFKYVDMIEKQTLSPMFIVKLLKYSQTLIDIISIKEFPEIPSEINDDNLDIHYWDYKRCL